jgi:hypothetical protein
MAQYPQGVTSFIPDYQPYQPDFNFSSNILQLKQTQYDQNWQRLNNMYGQILNAPLTHDESLKRRDNTFKRIDFDLKRVTGLDLSLDQNVNQASQIFRPFYEDASLMKDMVFTKNASFEKSLGEGKRYNTDEKVNSQYWDGGLRAIDYKIQEFKQLPYEQLPGFGDVKYTPYVNTEKMALDLATKMKYKVKRTSVTGDWIITEQNGEQIVAPLQSILYKAIGQDPKVQEFYSTLSYLSRKDYAMSNKDNPEFKGNPELAERKYLGDALSMLRNQTELTRNNLLNEKSVNDRIISRLEESMKNGQETPTTQESLQKYRQANEDITNMLNKTNGDLSLISDNINKTLTSTGGTKLSMDDLGSMRNRVDAVMASTMLQADISDAARKFAYMDYSIDYQANPYGVQKQKFMYDSSLIAQRAAAQKDVALFKHQLGLEEKRRTAKLKSGAYEEDPKTGEVKLKPELEKVQASIEEASRTGDIQPEKLIKTVDDIYEGDAKDAKKLLVSMVREMQSEGLISNSEIISLFDQAGTGNDGGLGMMTIKPFLKWVEKTQGGKEAGGGALYNMASNVAQKVTGKKAGPPDARTKQLLDFGMYTTQLEKEVEGPNAGKEEADAKLRLMTSGDLQYTSPEAISRMTNRMSNLIAKKKDDPYFIYNSKVNDLMSINHSLNDYTGYRYAMKDYKKNRAKEIMNQLEGDGYKYGKYLFDEDYNMVSTPEEFLTNVAGDTANEIENNTGMSWAGFWKTVGASTSAGAGLGSVIPGAGTAAGGGLGFLAGGLGYLTTGAFETAWNQFFGDDKNTNNVRLKNGKYASIGGKYTVKDEFDAMKEAANQLSLKTDIPILGGLNKYMENGKGFFSKVGAAIKVVTGERTPTYDMFKELKQILDSRVDFNDGRSYVSFSGVNMPMDKISDEDRGDGSTPEANLKIFRTIYNDISNRFFRKDDKLKDFGVTVTPFGGEDATKAAVKFKLPYSYLEQFKPKKDDKSAVMSEKMWNKLVTNGLTVITDAKNLQSTTLYRNSYASPEQMRVKRAGSKGVTYKDPRYPSYNLNMKLDPSDNSRLLVTTSFLNYDGPEKGYSTSQNVTPLANMGYNIKTFRDNWFNETVPYLIQQQIQIKNQYGK